MERSGVVGDASEWSELRAALHRWQVKRRSGFDVPDADAMSDAGTVQADVRLLVTARLGPFVGREPVEVVAIADRDDRTGFAYATLAGEEPFVLHRDGEAVVLTIRSLSRPAPSGPWRAVFPLLLSVQVVALRRYLRVLR